MEGSGGERGEEECMSLRARARVYVCVCVCVCVDGGMFFFPRLILHG